ncbi:MAG: transglycosylase domain-containing protein, partial [bacterium]
MFLRTLIFTIILCCCTALGAFFYLLENNPIDASVFYQQIEEKPSIVLDDQGKELARFALDKRAPITFDQIPDIVIKAFLAAEDHDFFNHYGISIRGIARTMLVNMYHRRIVQGASTITQQVARRLFLNNERTWIRKI